MDFTIPAVVRRAAREFGDATAIAEPGGPLLSYRELHERIQATAGALIGSGIEPGDRIAIWSPNTGHWVLAALGTLYAGATLVPVNTRFTGPEALDVISRSRARGLIVADRFLGADRLAMLVAAAEEESSPAATAGPGQLRLPSLIVQIPIETSRTPAACPALDWPALDWAAFMDLASAVPAATADVRASAVHPDDVSDILFTSGTTGRSKGVMSAHRQALDVARAWADCAGLSPADRYLIVNPFFHSFGYKAGLLACLLTGATIVPQLAFDATAAMRLIESERITVLPGAPTIYSSILDHPDQIGRASCRERV